MNNVNEKSTAFLTVSFYDKDNVLSVPTYATWKVHDVESGTVMLATTNITPLASQVELTLTPAINTFVDINNQEETRRVTVMATGSGYMVHDDYDYNIIGLVYV